MDATYVYICSFRQFRTAKQFAKDDGEEIPDSIICRSGYNNLFATGFFTQPCYEWRMLKPDSVKTWGKFQNHFTLAANDRKKVTTTTSDVGSHSDSNTITTTSAISALTAAIMKQKLSNSKKIKNTLNLLQFNSLQSSSPANTVTTNPAIAFILVHRVKILLKVTKKVRRGRMY